MLTIANIGRILAGEEKPPGAMTKKEFYEREIAEWIGSAERMEQVTAKLYYQGVQDIRFRRRTIIDDSGVPVEIKYLPNNHIVDNQFKKMIDQKTNYLFGKEYTMSSENDKYLEALSDYFDADFQRFLHTVGKGAYLYGIEWVFVYYDEQGKLRFRALPGYEVLPFWADDDHTLLDAAIRVYKQTVWEGGAKKVIDRVEVYEKDGMYRYRLEGNTLVPDVELGSYAPYVTVDTVEKSYSYTWERFPLIAFRPNVEEMPLIRDLKAIQDAINVVASDAQNQMEENVHNTVFVLKGYYPDGNGTVRHNIASGGVIAVDSDGDVKTLTLDRDILDYKNYEDLLQRAMESNARGFSAKSEQFSAYTNKMNLQSLYAEIDLDSNLMETEFQRALRELLWFIQQDLKTKGVGDFEGEEVRFTFNKDIVTNESETITNAMNSVGIISDETIIENHPWVKNWNVERQRMERERKEQEQYDMFSKEDTGEDKPIKEKAEKKE